MEVLHALEKKVGTLVELTKRLKEENIQLHLERAQYRAQLETLERALLVAEERNKEIGLTTVAVDELIRHIDLFVEQEMVGSSESLAVESAS
jgi:hypothetical protein